jgi:DNA-binding NarL/FixJ family response regulator
VTDHIRVVIADDQALVRGGFALILEADGIEVVGQASDGAEAVSVVRQTRPDIVLMDVRMPGIDGLEAARLILAPSGQATPRVIMLTTFDLDEYAYAALALGASGFLLKDVSPERLVSAIRLIRDGDAVLGPAITQRLMERFARQDRAIIAPLHRSLSVLTQREMDVLRVLARGLSNAEIAHALQVSEATVKTHMARILTKLELRDRAQAIVLAYETGLVMPGAANGPAQ